MSNIIVFNNKEYINFTTIIENEEEYDVYVDLEQNILFAQDNNIVTDKIILNRLEKIVTAESNDVVE